MSTTSKRPAKSSRRSQTDGPSEVIRRPRKAVAKELPVEEETVLVQETAPIKERKPRTKKTVQEEKKEEIVDLEREEEEVVVEEEVLEELTKNQKLRKDVLTRFDSIIESIGTELETSKNEKTVSLKFLKNVLRDVKKLRMQTTKAMKMSNKRKTGAPSGFEVPVWISDELSKFMGVDGMVSRTNVTSFICSYVKEHKLQDPNDGRVILAQKDKRLANLVNYKEGDVVTFFNLQNRIKHHYQKPE